MVSKTKAPALLRRMLQRRYFWVRASNHYTTTVATIAVAMRHLIIDAYYVTNVIHEISKLFLFPQFIAIIPDNYFNHHSDAGSQLLPNCVISSELSYDVHAPTMLCQFAYCCQTMS